MATIEAIALITGFVNHVVRKAINKKECMKNNRSGINQQSDLHQSIHDANENTHATDNSSIDNDVTQ